MLFVNELATQGAPISAITVDWHPQRFPDVNIRTVTLEGGERPWWPWNKPFIRHLERKELPEALMKWADVPISRDEADAAEACLQQGFFDNHLVKLLTLIHENRL